VAAVTLSNADLAPFASIDDVKAQAMIDDALALAARVAPCILDATFTYDGAAKAIIRGAILRWNDAGSGALQSETAGDYSYTRDTRQPRRGLFWPSEIEQLQDLCKGEQTSGAFSIDTAGTTITIHADICAINFGATYCSCGADLAGYSLWENV
jgi:hypothetical protein